MSKRKTYTNRMEVRLWTASGSKQEFIGSPSTAIALAFHALIGCPSARATLLLELKTLSEEFAAKEASGEYPNRERQVQ